MISARYLLLNGYKDIQAFYDETTGFYIAGKTTQARNNLNAMGKEQKKEYFFYVLALYPERKEFLEFVMAFI